VHPISTEENTNMSTATFVEQPLIRAILPVQRRLTLEMLQRFGPLAIESFPRAWPLGREHQRAIVGELEAEGALALSFDPRVPGRPLARLTERGARVLREMNDDAMRALVAAGGSGDP
jgi:hypothetical protein